MMECLGKDRSLGRFGELGDGWFHKSRLPLVNRALGMCVCYTDLGLKLARSSASSQSKVVFVSGFSPSLEQLSMK
jgi:hypothetical protein